MDPEDVKREGVKLLEEFSEKLDSVAESKATHYVVDMKNVWRPDADPEVCEGFSESLKELAPKFKDGYVVTEKGV